MAEQIQELDKFIMLDDLIQNRKIGSPARITHQDLCAMKASSDRLEAPRVKLIQRISYQLVKFALTVKAWFLYRDAPRKVCQHIGHKCEQCGMTVPFVIDKS